MTRPLRPIVLIDVIADLPQVKGGSMRHYTLSDADPENVH